MNIKYELIPDISIYDFYGCSFYIIGCFHIETNYHLMYGFFKNEKDYLDIIKNYNINYISMYCKKIIFNDIQLSYKQFLIDWKKAIIHYTM